MKLPLSHSRVKRAIQETAPGSSARIWALQDAITDTYAKTHQIRWVTPRLVALAHPLGTPFTLEFTKEHIEAPQCSPS